MELKRKRICALLLAVLLMSMLIQTALAVDNSRSYTLTLTPDKSSASAGDVITFTLTLSGSEGAIYGFQDELEWNTGVFELVGEPSPSSGFSVTKKSSGSNARAAFSFVSTAGGTTFGLPLTVGTLTLKLKTNGAATVYHKDYKLTNRAGTDVYQVTAQDARINAGASSSPETPTQSGDSGVVKTEPTLVTPSTSVQTDSSTGKLTAVSQVRSEDIVSAVEDAKNKAAAQASRPENSGKKIVAEVIIDLTTSSGNTVRGKLDLTVRDVNTIAGAQNVSLVIRTDSFSAVEFSDQALLAITAGKPSTEGVTLTVEKGAAATVNLTDAQKTVVGGDTILELRIEISGKAVRDFRGGEVAISVNYDPPASLPTADRELLTAYHIAEDGTTEVMKGSSYSGGQMRFSTTHFSAFFIREWMNPFTDIKKDDWFYKAARYTNVNGLIAGLGNTETFAPNVTVTRAQMVTMLWRASGSPSYGSSSSFSDVPAGQWYTSAVNWANANNVVAGNGDGTFAPNRDITRQEMAKMLHNYVLFQGNVDSADTALTFVDSAAIADWALSAVKWCAANGVINGDENKNFNPVSSARRSELAQIFRNYGMLS